LKVFTVGKGKVPAKDASPASLISHFFSGFGVAVRIFSESSVTFANFFFKKPATQPDFFWNLYQPYQMFFFKYRAILKLF